MRPHDILSLAVTAASCVVTANSRPGSPLAALALCIAVGFGVRAWMLAAHAASFALPCAGRALSIGASCGPRYWYAPDCGNALVADASEDTLRLPAEEYVL